MEITTKPFFFSFFFFSFFLHTWLYLLMTPALIMLVIPGLPSYNAVEVYYLKGVIGLPIVISFRDRWYIHIFFWKWAHWWRHRHRLDRFRFQNFLSPGGHHGFPIGTILAIFWSTGHPDASYQVSSQLAQGCRRSRLLKQLLTPHDGRRTLTDHMIAHHEHYMLRWAKRCRNPMGVD